MATASTTFATSTWERPLNRTLAIYFKEAKYEFLTRLRLRAYSISTISFPLMFYVLFGLVLNSKDAAVGGTTIATYLIPSYGTFGVMGASLFGTASGLAAERGLGWLQVKRASPMPPFAYFMAKVALGMIFSTVVVLLLLLLGFVFGGVRMPLLGAAKLLAILVAGSLPFLPPYHLAQLALSVVGAGQHESNWTHWEALIGFFLICIGVARLGFQRDEGKMYG